MKRSIIAISCLAFMICACTNSNNSSSIEQTQTLVGMTENALTLLKTSIATDDGVLHVECYLDNTAQNVCAGELDNGKTVSPEQVQDVLNTLYIDPKIDNSLKDGCENKTLLLEIELKLDLPAPNASEFCFWTDESNTIISCDGEVVSQEEAEAKNRQALEKLASDLTAARQSGLDTFMTLNPNLVSSEQAKSYVDVLYGALNIKLDACEYQSFIDKNRDILSIVALRDLVANDNQTMCEKSVEYKILLETNNYGETTQAEPLFKIMSSKDELQALNLHDLDDKIIEAIDFTKDVVVYLSGGQKSDTGYSLKIDDICVDSPIDVKITRCAGQPADTALSEPVMLIQLPKSNYKVEFSEHKAVCE